mgnify:CR=1 FL=1
MKWSLKLGRILGIDVYIHVTFLLLLGFVGLAHWLPDRSLPSALSGVGFFMGLFACVLLHEYGHALMARRYGIKTRDITLLPIGGVARLERMPEQPIQELWVALAGPAVNVVIAAVLFVWLNLTSSWDPVSSLSMNQGNLLERLFAVNVFLVLFNMLPAFPMDGGRVLRSLLAMRMEYSRATNIAATIGQGMALLFGFVGLFSNPMLLFIALFVWFGASQEAEAAAMKSSLAGVLVREAMLTEFKTLAPHETLGAVTKLLLAGSQQDFPVVEHGQVVGLLVRTDLFAALREQGEDVTVAAVMQRDFEILKSDELLDAAFSRVQPEKGLTMPVMKNSQLVGLLNAENLGEFFMIRAALANRHRQPPAPPVITGPPDLLRHSST